MASRIGASVTRSLLSSARAAPRPSLHPSPSAAGRLRPPSSRRPSFFPSRNLGELGCIQSLLPLHSVVAKTHLTSHLNVNSADLCLSCSTYCQTCQDH